LLVSGCGYGADETKTGQALYVAGRSDEQLLAWKRNNDTYVAVNNVQY